jgi:hypothetical protein
MPSACMVGTNGDNSRTLPAGDQEISGQATKRIKYIPNTVTPTHPSPSSTNAA